MRLSDIGDKVHLWSASLDVSPAQAAQLTNLLAPDEYERSSRFHFDRDRRRFVVRRAYLRLLLGQYLNVPPRELTFVTQMNRKPVLRGGGIEFNLSHSDEQAVFAVARSSVGVDIERVQPDVPSLCIAHSFTIREQEFIVTRLPDDQLAAFFSCWTCKEACVKALGVGLAMSLKDFDVTEALAAAPAGVSIWLGDGKPRELRLTSLLHFPGYALALAAEGLHDDIEFYTFNPPD